MKIAFVGSFFRYQRAVKSAFLVEILSLDVTDSYLLTFSPDDLTTDARPIFPNQLRYWSGYIPSLYVSDLEIRYSCIDVILSDGLKRYFIGSVVFLFVCKLFS